MVSPSNRFRNSASAFLLILLIVGAAVHTPFVQTALFRAFVLPLVQKAFVIDVHVTKCHFDWWNQKITLENLRAQHEENSLFISRAATIQWKHPENAWNIIDSVAIQGLQVELLECRKWYDFRQKQTSVGTEEASGKMNPSVDIRIGSFLLQNIEGSIESESIIQIDEALLSDMHFADESLHIPLKACSGFIAIPPTSHLEKQVKLDIKSLITDLHVKKSIWSLDTLAAETSLFDAHLSPSRTSNEWHAHVQFVDSIDFNAFALDSNLNELLASLVEAPLAPIIDGRIWVDEVTSSMNCALAVEGIPELGNFSDSLRFQRKNGGSWSSNGKLDLDWNTLGTGLEIVLGDRMPAAMQSWKNQGHFIPLTWNIAPLSQQFDFGLPMLNDSEVDLNIVCSEPWKPSSFRAKIQNLHIPLVSQREQTWSGSILGQIEQQKSSLAMTLQNGENVRFNLNATSVPNSPGNQHQIDAQWKSESLLLPMSGDCNLAFDDSSWNFNSATQLEGIRGLNLSGNSDWALFAAIAFRASGDRTEQWSSVLETRNITLLEDKKPIAFDRFDLMLDHQEEQIFLEWHSDLTNGRLSASDDLSTWKRWLERITGKDDNDAKIPFVEFNASLLNFRPIQLMTNTPFSVAPFSSFSGKSFSDQLFVNAHLPMISSAPFAAHEIHAEWLLNESTSAFELHVDSIKQETSLLAADFNSDLKLGTDWEGTLTWKQGNKGGDARVGFTSTPPLQSEGQLKITDLYWPLLGQNLELMKPNDLIRWSSTENFQAAHEATSVCIQSQDWNIKTQAYKDLKSNWSAELELTIEGDENAIGWLTREANVSSLTAQFKTYTSEAKKHGVFHLYAKEVEWRDERIANLSLSGTGWLDDMAFDAHGNFGAGEIAGNGTAGWGSFPFLEATWDLKTIELNGINQLIPDNTFNLSGDITGQLKSQWKNDEFEFSGNLRTDSLTTFIPALGTTYTIESNFEIEPGTIQINQGRIQDRTGSIATMNGTAYHKQFRNWNLDFGIDATSNPIELMNLPPAEAAFYYGSGICTGDISVAGYGSELLIEADIAAKKGTDFALPLDAVSDASYAQFIQFKTTDSLPPVSQNMGHFSNIVLDIGLDVEPDATARIVFNQNTGEEILGKAEGHLDLRVNDFEDITLKGSLEVIAGTYYFTLQNLINKTFNIVPGGTIEWFGDPYAAQIDLLTSYQTRARLNPLLPDEPNLPGRVPIELLLSLNGGLFQPEIGFNIEVPEADSRLEALIRGALLNEEELQRQALSLLVVNQFISQDPLNSALGGFQSGGQSSAFIANQLGHWISQISPGMDLGLDYSNNNLSGEQELALALSTQLFNERLKIEGEFGAQSTGQMSTDDIQIQDITVSYDLDAKGQYQVTGQSKSNQSMINTLDGSSTQGVGIRMRHEFNRWGDWRVQKTDREID